MICLKRFCAVALVLVSFLALSAEAYAFSFSSTYNHLPSTNSNVINLINYAASYDTFLDSDFVVFQDEQYSYYLVWGDLQVEENRVVSVDSCDVEYVRYYRTDSSGYNSSYDYMYGVESDFSLTTQHVCTSNLPNFGFKSQTFNSYRNETEIGVYLMVLGSFLLTLMIVNLRRNKS